MAETKERILRAALDLFSEYGYEAVSVGQLAAAVGIKAPSLYKHYSSKQEIFEALIAWLSEQYESRSVLAVSRQRDIYSDYAAIAGMSPEEYADILCKQLEFITGDPVVSKTRKLLVIEQFRNPELCAILEKRHYQDIYEYHKGVVRYLIHAGVLIDADADIMALQLMSPVTVELQRADRNPGYTAEAEDLIRKHIIQFFRVYGKHNK